MNVKNRFVDQPQTYRTFIEAMRVHQAEQHPIDEILEPVNSLLAGHPDLLQEFAQFLSDSAKKLLSKVVTEAKAKEPMDVEPTAKPQASKNSGKPADKTETPTPPSVNAGNTGKGSTKKGSKSSKSPTQGSGKNEGKNDGPKSQSSGGGDNKPKATNKAKVKPTRKTEKPEEPTLPPSVRLDGPRTRRRCSAPPADLVPRHAAAAVRRGRPGTSERSPACRMPACRSCRISARRPRSSRHRLLRSPRG